MPKRLRLDPIYVAPKIKGFKRRDGSYVVYDELKHTNLDPTNVDDKIKIYERQVKGWFLDRATRLINGKYTGFVILMIGISYIEGVQQYIEDVSSRGNSKAFFVRGLKRIFGLDDIALPKLELFYSEVRCGLFHNGMTENRVIINKTFDDSIKFDGDDIKINQKMFIDKIKNDFKDYILKLRNTDETTLRNNFDSMFSIL